MVNEPFFNIIQGDSRTLVKNLQEVHCIITSPPYYKQRQYGNDINEIGQYTNEYGYITDIVNIIHSTPLHIQGSVWVNIGDKRLSDGLMGIPEMFMMAMMRKNFHLIDKVIWAKSEAFEDGSTTGSFMPEPANGRLNGNAYEVFYHFTKSKKYWSDTLSVQLNRDNIINTRCLPEDLMSVEHSLNGRNLHNVWRINQGQTKEKHYAVFPPALVERPIAMTCPLFTNPDKSLPTRIVDRTEYNEGRGNRSFGKNDDISSVEKKGRQDTGRKYIPTMPISKGWEAILTGATPGIVFDPFCGTGTTGEVALKLGRSFIGIDLYEEYIEIAQNRCHTAKTYVEQTYGYDRVYEMIMIDQTDKFTTKEMELIEI